MKAILTIVVSLMVVGVVFGQYDPPEIIGVLTSPQESGYLFGTDFVWIGDQNNDGYDDILISQPEYGDSYAYIFHGGRNIVNSPAFTYTQYAEFEDVDFRLGGGCVYLGDFLPDTAPLVAFYNNTYPDPILVWMDLYLLDDDLDNDPYFTIDRGSVQDGLKSAILYGQYKRPFDFNNDGYMDFMNFEIIPNEAEFMQVYYGGEEMDTIADWKVQVDDGTLGDYVHGYDFNGDGYGDILTYEEGIYSFYLGGNPADTIPVLSKYAGDSFLTTDFACLPDINGDGFDDWCIGWFYRAQSPEDTTESGSGFYVYLGSEEPDFEPDLQLRDTRDAWLTLGPICGGDFNGDGYGDIVVLTGGSDEDHGQSLEFQIHFGNRWIAEDGPDVKREPDLEVDFEEEYYEYRHDVGNKFLGAVGDYNGDKVDDFVWRNSAKNKVIIFGGNSEWETGVETEVSPPESYTLTLEAYPNPFNSTVTISYTQPIAVQTSITVYDLAGRVIERLMQGQVAAGRQTLIWDASGVSAGEYVVRVESTGHGGVPHAQTVEKVVLVK